MYKVIALILLASVCPAQAQYSGGSGTAEDPYQIATAADLILLGQAPQDCAKHFIMTADIDLDPNLPGGKVFDRAVIAPNVDDDSSSFRGTPFTGVFDGCGHKISNLTIEGRGHLALFGQLESTGEVRNLGVADVNITGSRGHLAGLVGDNNGSIVASYSTGTIAGAGGVVRVGGLVGENHGSIVASYSTGTIAGDGCFVGGLVGHNDDDGSITTSYSIGTVTGGEDTGGLAGHSDGSITSCYSIVTVTGLEWCGALVGRNDGTMTTSFTAGTRSNGIGRGGCLVGHNHGSITSCFLDIQTIGHPNCGVFEPNYANTTAEMKQQATFEGWDFVNVWDIGENQTYPFLRTTSAGDINKDGIVNFLDLCIVSEQWME